MKFNNKILFAITALSIVIGLLLSNYITALNNFKTITCIVIFFSAIMLYNAILKEKENKIAKEKEEKEEKLVTEGTEGKEDNVANLDLQITEPKNDAESTSNTDEQTDNTDETPSDK